MTAAPKDLQSIAAAIHPPALPACDALESNPLLDAVLRTGGCGPESLKLAIFDDDIGDDFRRYLLEALACVYALVEKTPNDQTAFVLARMMGFACQYAKLWRALPEIQKAPARHYGGLRTGVNPRDEFIRWAKENKGLIGNSADILNLRGHMPAGAVEYVNKLTSNDPIRRALKEAGLVLTGGRKTKKG